MKKTGNKKNAPEKEAIIPLPAGGFFVVSLYLSEAFVQLSVNNLPGHVSFIVNNRQVLQRHFKHFKITFPRFAVKH